MESCCRWPWMTPNHLNFYILRCLIHLRNWWLQRLQIWCTSWIECASHSLRMTNRPLQGLQSYRWNGWTECRQILSEKVRSFFAGRGPAYFGPQRWDLYIGPIRQPRERRGFDGVCGVCARCVGWVGMSSLSGISKRAPSRRGLQSG